VCTVFLQINHAQELVSQAVKWEKMMDARETQTVFSGGKNQFLVNFEIYHMTLGNIFTNLL
jgi:hypothetical protein